MNFTDIQTGDLLLFDYDSEHRVVVVSETEVNLGKMYINGYKHTENECSFRKFLWDKVYNLAKIDSKVSNLHVAPRENNLNYYVTDDTVITYSKIVAKPVSTQLFLDGNNLVDANGLVYASLSDALVQRFVIMAITPKQYLKNKEAVILDMEKIIDSHLEKSYDALPFCLSISLLPGFYQFQNEILSLYRKVGWKNLQVVSDQRDGDYLSFNI